MLPHRPLLCLLISAGMASGGDYFRFDAALSPGKRSASLHGFIFAEKAERLRVIDREAGQPKWDTLGDGFSTIQASAGCNGGYSTPDGKPIGLVISHSTTINPLDPSNATATGLVLVKPSGITIVKAATATQADLAGATEGLQGGPILVENGKPTAALDANSYARHTVLLGSGDGQWAIIYVPSATTDGLARLLADGTSFPKFKVTTALNLGTGLSSALWLARTENALPLYLREVNPVRSGLAILPK